MGRRPDSAPRIGLDTGLVSLLDGFVIRAYRGALQFAFEHTDWEIVLLRSQSDAGGDEALAERAATADLDGLIFHYTRPPGVLERLSRMGLAMVHMGSAQESELPRVVIDNREIGRMGARHFLERGFRHLGFCGVTGVGVSTERGEGFLGEVEAAGGDCSLFIQETAFHPLREYLTGSKPSGFWRDPGALGRWLESLPHPVGIMGYHDALALSIYKVCRQMEIRIPAEVAILGVEAMPVLTDSSGLSISSVDPAARACGYEAAGLLARCLAGEDLRGVCLRVPPLGVIQRASTDIMAVEDPAVDQAVRFICERFADPISVTDVARAANMSRTGLSRRFRDAMGHTVTDEIRRRRVARAQMLLRDTRLSVEEIARATGFRDHPHLSNTLLRMTGMRPGQWRRVSHVSSGTPESPAST